MKSPIDVMERSLGPTAFNVTALLGEGAFGFGLGFGIGQMYVRHNDKYVGRNAPWLTMALGKGVAAAIEILTGGDGGMGARIFNVIGQTGASCSGLEVGLDHARVAKKLPAPQKTAMGALPPAAEGRGLTWKQLEEIAQMS